MARGLERSGGQERDDSPSQSFENHWQKRCALRGDHQSLLPAALWVFFKIEDRIEHLTEEQSLMRASYENGELEAEKISLLTGKSGQADSKLGRQADGETAHDVPDRKRKCYDGSCLPTLPFLNNHRRKKPTSPMGKFIDRKRSGWCRCYMIKQGR